MTLIDSPGIFVMPNFGMLGTSLLISALYLSLIASSRNQRLPG